MFRILLTSLFLATVLHAGDIKTIHVFVPLCDNENQGIVPVPKKLGIGTDLVNNLYWGAAYGVKSYFLKSPGWKLVRTDFITSGVGPSPSEKRRAKESEAAIVAGTMAMQLDEGYTLRSRAEPEWSYETSSKDIKDVDTVILERCIFKHGNYYLCADAYKGIEIKRTIHDLLASAAGDIEDSIVLDSVTTIGLYGKADVLAYVGHNGLMDFKLDSNYTVKKNSSKKGIILLCCMSKKYFYDTIKSLNGDILLMTTGLLSPESYTLRSAVEAWMARKNKAEIVNAAAQAYHQYQKCGIKAAKRLFFAE